MSVKYFRRQNSTEPTPKLSPDPKSPNFLFITANAYAKREQNKDYKGSNSLFCLFHLFFFPQHPASLHEPVSIHRSSPQSSRMVIDCDTATCSYTSSFRLQKVRSPEHIIRTPTRSILTKKRRGESALSAAVTPALNL